MRKQCIEDKIDNIVLRVVKKWEGKFTLLGVRIEKSNIRQNNSSVDYFSELEIDFWSEHNNNLITTASIIIFMNNKLILNIDNAYSFVEQEIEECYLECKQIIKDTASDSA